MIESSSAAKKNLRRRCCLIAALSVVSLPASTSSASDAFARVGDDAITYDDFEREVGMAARQTYYHGRPSSEEAFIRFRKSVAESLVDRHLLLREASRRGIEPEHDRITDRLKSYEQRYGSTERWKLEGAAMLSALRQRFEQDSIIEILERSIRATGEPTDEETLQFYRNNPDKFTEPQQHRLSVIVLSVEPAAIPPVWAAARTEATRIIERLRQGTQFSELARLHSSDRSAGQGGDMGYLHAGMLSPSAESAIKELSVGDTSEPVTVLEGIAIFRLTDRKPEQLQSYVEVKARASDLLVRNMSERQWDSMLAKLRGAGDVFVDTAYLSSVPAQP